MNTSFFRPYIALFLTLFASIPTTSSALNPFSSLAKISFGIGKFITERRGLLTVGLTAIFCTYGIRAYMRYNNALQAAIRTNTQLNQQVQKLHKQLDGELAVRQAQDEFWSDQLREVLAQKTASSSHGTAPIRDHDSKSLLRLVELEHQNSALQQKIHTLEGALAKHAGLEHENGTLQARIRVEQEELRKARVERDTMKVNEERSAECSICMENREQKHMLPYGFFFECVCRNPICFSCAHKFLIAPDDTPAAKRQCPLCNANRRATAVAKTEQFKFQVGA